MMTGRWTGMLLVAVLTAVPLRAQDGTPEAEARSRALSERMKVTLREQARVLAQMQRELTRAANADARSRDSIVRITSQRIAELAGQIAQVQMEADRVQGAAVDAETRAALRVQITSARAMANVTRALAGQQRALTFMSSAAPRGYLGVTLSGTQNTELRDGRVFTLYESPLSIESVAPESPAARGGLQAGDTIVAFGRLPVPGPVPLAEVLRPGERVSLRIRRGGRERTVTVVADTIRTMRVAAGSFAFTFDSARMCYGDQCSSDLAALEGRRVTGLVLPSAVAPPRPAAPSPPGGVAPSVALGMVQWSSTDYSIAGAVMTTITAELEGLTGVSDGVLVLRVAPGTPASSSGLRGGDVIVRVAGEESRGVRDLQRAVQRASSRGDRALPLVVRREKKESGLTLRW